MKKIFLVFLAVVSCSVFANCQQPQRIKVLVRGMVVMDTLINQSEEIIMLDLTSPGGQAKPSSMTSNRNNETNFKTRESRAIGKTDTDSHTSRSTKSNSSYKQCAATTRKGTRCSRRADPGSNYCWQHKR